MQTFNFYNENISLEIKNIISLVAEGAQYFDQNAVVLWANEAEAHNLGYSLEEYIGMSLEDLCVEADDARIFLEQLETQGTLHNYPMQLKGKDGSIKYVVMNACKHWQDNKFSYIRCFSRDITQEKAKEADFKRTIGDLEKFNYIASHDLQAPLRALNGYCELLKLDAGDAMPESAQEDIKGIVTATKNMKNLLNDLLRYSRISRPEDLSDVSLNECIKQVLDFYHKGIQELDVRVEIGEIPNMTGYEKLVLQLFDQLISNALKFRSPERKLKIEITHNDSCICVKDNGIGIDAKYAELIFEPMKKLHDESAYIGTGLGLAIAKKIVEKHNGKIWVDTSYSDGLSIFFTLNAKD